MEDFIKIIIKGLQTERNYLVEYFERRVKKSKYKSDTFFSKCLEVIELMSNDLNSQLIEDQRNLNHLHKENPAVGYLKDKRDLSINDYSIHLSSFTGGKYVGHLWAKDIREAQTAIIMAMIKKNIVSNKQEPISDKNIEQISKNPHPEIFKDYKSFCLFRDFINPVNEKNYLRDLSFIFRAMQRERPPLIHAHFKPGMYKDWLGSNYPNLPYLMEVKTYDIAHSKEREKRYKSIKNIIFK